MQHLVNAAGVPFVASESIFSYICENDFTMPEGILRPLFESYTGRAIEGIEELPSSGSNRRYYRLKGGSISLIGVIGTSTEENRAFIQLSRHFKAKRLPVPQVLSVSEDLRAYIQEDLGKFKKFDPQKTY